MSQIHTPQLPWNDAADRRLFIPLLAAFLVAVLIVGVIIPAIDVPGRDRQELEKLPPQLARVIERKKLEKPKPVIPPKAERKPEPKPEPRQEPEPKPAPKPLEPKPQPKPVQKPKVKASEQKREQARETAKKTFGNDALNALSAIRDQVPVAELNTASRNLSGAGSKATEVGSVVDRKAAAKTSGGVNVASLTKETVGEKLSDRRVTEVEVTAEQAEATAAAKTRSQEELNLVFEQYKVQYDRIYRGALRKDPTLAGSVMLKLDVQPDGSVSSCTIAESELKDAGLQRRLVSKCKQMVFDKRSGIAVTTVEYPIRFKP